MSAGVLDVWVNGAYFPQKGRMGGGYVVVQPNGVRLSHHFRLIAEGYPASPVAAEYMAAIKAIHDQSPDQHFDIFCDNEQIVEDINRAQEVVEDAVKNRELRSLLRKVAKDHHVRAYRASGHQHYTDEARVLAEMGALTRPQR